MNDDTCVFYIRELPVLIRDRFKSMCARRSVTMRETVIALIQVFGEMDDVNILSNEQKLIDLVLKRVKQNRWKAAPFNAE